MAEAHRQQEIELKLAFRGEDRAKLEATLARLGPGRRQKLVTTYFDTPDRRLARHGIGLRIRAAGDQRIQTVKAAGDGAAAGSRGEWEERVAGDQPDLDRLQETPAAALLARGPLLDPLFRTEVERATHEITLEDGSTVEAAIDEGLILAGDRQEEIRELELELKSGTIEALYRLALRLQDTLTLTLGTASKQARGQALATGEPGPAVKAEPPQPRQSWTAATAFRRLAGSALAQLLANVAPSLREDVEGLHQSRVALRRLRAIFALFAPLLWDPAVEPLDERLRRLGQILGEARDWDVFCLETLPRAAEQAKPEAIWPDQIRLAAEARRGQAWEMAKAAIAAPDFTALVLAMAAQIEGDALLADEKKARQRIVPTGRALLDRQARKVRRRGKHATRLEGAALHSLRKAMKKLRYGIDGLGALYGETRAARYQAGCKRLQKVLGTLNDMAVAERQVTALATETSRVPGPATEAMVQELRRRRRKQHRKLEPAWREFRAAEAFWR